MKVSVITPTYRTDPNVLARTWASLRRQTLPADQWEWVVWDDTPDETVWRQLYGFAADERHYLIAHRSHVHSGSIGQVKRKGFMVAEGEILVELDHDDELEPTALEEVQRAFMENPDVGFVYSDWCELLPNGDSGKYPPGWAFGFGSEHYDEKLKLWVMDTPPINPTTLRHIVSSPNHLRAWRADWYHSLGGHDPTWPVCDDYELYVRTFLVTKCHHIPKMLYRQHISGQTAQRQRNAEIQQRVGMVVARFDAAITERCAELGIGLPA